MITQLTSIEELKQIFIESLLNKTTEVTKVSDGSVLNGFAYGCAKIGQKALKEVALVESHLLPDSAVGDILDIIASNRGIAARFGASSSSTYLRLVGDEGTFYDKTSNKFNGNHGIEFVLEDDVTIGVHGFTYVKVRSTDTGEKTNVDPLTINLINPTPAGHAYVVNEYIATGGLDVETDDLFRKRIKEGPNILARGTLNYLTQVFNKINSDVLRVFYKGVGSNGKNQVGIVTQNGVDLNANELDALIDQGKNYFNLADLQPYAEDYVGIELSNIEYHYIDISLRAKIKDSYDPDSVRKELQVQMSKYFDLRFWKSTDKVEWDDLLLIAKNNNGIEYVADNYFTPNTDIAIEKNKLPRVRGFLLLDLDGDIISSISGTLNPVYYPQGENDFSFQSTVLKDI